MKTLSKNQRAKLQTCHLATVKIMDRSSIVPNGSLEDIKIGILHSVGGFFITNEGTKAAPMYHVWIPTITHSIADSAYRDISLAVVRCNYLYQTKVSGPVKSKRQHLTTQIN